MKTATIGLVVLLSLGAGSCVDARMPATMPPAFLQTESKAWTAWLDGETRYGSFGGFTARDILNRLAGPADLKIDESPALDRQVPYVELAGLSVRAALWKVSSECGVRIAWAGTHEPRTFMGALETEVRRNGPNGATTLTEVMHGDYNEYLRLKAENRIAKEEIQDGVLFYAVRQDRCLPFANGSSAMFSEFERYKTPAPKGR